MLQIDQRSRSARIRHAAFTLVEMMIVVAIIALLAAITVPSFLRARKRSQATMVKNDLRLIDSAIAQYAIETMKTTGDPVYIDDWQEYIKDNTRLADSGQDILGNDFNDQVVDSLPYVPGTTWDLLSDVADTAFWSPYTREVTQATPPARHKGGRRHHPRG